MCGILGFVNSKYRCDWRRALSVLHSRGPDETGVVKLNNALFAHRRLAVIDRHGGHQPMTAEEGRFSVVFNGEIYNFAQLRQQLRSLGHHFHSHSDTEVILRGYIQWGEDMTLRLDGMFAFAIWDDREQTLFAARDRLGIKPFFYSLEQGFIFASTLEPFFSLTGFPRPMDYEALRDFLAFQTVLAPRSMLDNVQQLAAANCLRYNAATRQCIVRPYWEIAEPDQDASRNIEQWVETTDKALKSSVKAQLVADVPVGAFLSGGVDSALMVHYMAEAGAHPLRTFSMRFKEQGFDESPAALAVAQKYNTEHHIIDAPEIDEHCLMAALEAQDQPLADPAYVMTTELARMTRTHVTVAISGDGGDELFGGYARFLDVAAHYPDNKFKKMMRIMLRHGLLPGSLLRRSLAGKDLLLYKKVELGSYPSSRKSMQHYLSAAAWFSSCPENTLEQWVTLVEKFQSPYETSSLMRADLWTYLSENCLMKTDRASMAHSLEVRVPMLSNSVLDLALSLPPDVHFHHGEKTLLQMLAKRHLPRQVWDRPKHGFSVPLEDYFRGQWHSVCDEHFKQVEHIAPFLNAAAVTDLWQKAQKKKASRRLAYTMFVLLVWLKNHSVTY